jgi:hypothetical protein
MPTCLTLNEMEKLLDWPGLRVLAAPEDARATGVMLAQAPVAEQVADSVLTAWPEASSRTATPCMVA